jgi:hypothetical protein
MAFDQATINAVWKKGKPSSDPAKWRWDKCGAWMGFAYYGKQDSEYGWHIDHIDPDGSDDLDNLQPLQWRNNIAKSDGRLVCVVTADGQHNRPV